jgi:hypothetical protein
MLLMLLAPFRLNDDGDGMDEACLDTFAGMLIGACTSFDLGDTVLGMISLALVGAWILSCLCGIRRLVSMVDHSWFPSWTELRRGLWVAGVAGLSQACLTANGMRMHDYHSDNLCANASASL